MIPPCAGVLAVSATEGMGSLVGLRLAQAARLPTMSAVIVQTRILLTMGLILLEALVALVLLVLIVWWTMFSGRQRGELPQRQDKDGPPQDAP